MSEVKVNKISPRTNCGTVTLGDSGDTIALGCGATQTGFGRTGTVDWITTVKVTGDSPITGVTGKGYFLNTTAGTITVNLPAGAAGSILAFKDYAGTWDTNAVTVTPNGSDKIAGIAGNATLKTERQSVTLIYIDSTQGWLDIHDSASAVTGPLYVAATGGNAILTCGDYKTHVFTGPGTFCVTCQGNCGGSDTVEYVVVAGGGSSGGDGIKVGQGHQAGGGGGAGGFRSYTSLPAPTVSPLNGPAAIPISARGAMPVTVGAGGAGLTANTAVGNSGSNSIFSTITSAGGGGGGSTAAPCDGDGGAGGSGGGGAARESPQPLSDGGAGNTPPVSPAQGQNGGTGGRKAFNVGSGGGGGAGAAAADQSPVCTAYGVSGGAGSYLADAFFGPTAPSYGQSPTPLAPNGRYFSGGGGGGSGNVSVPTPLLPLGGAGGGGNGHGGGTSPPYSGVANTGGGGGGSSHNITDPPSPGTTPLGGSGVVMIRYKFQ